MQDTMTLEVIKKAIVSLKKPRSPIEWGLTAPLYDRMKELGMCMDKVTRIDVAQARSKE